MATLSETEAASVREAIEARERILREQIGAVSGQTDDPRYLELAGTTHDPGDEAVANELMDDENASVDRHIRELRALELARTRLVNGEISICIDCGRHIGIKRLLANPVAVRCFECQSTYEKTHVPGAMAPPRL